MNIEIANRLVNLRKSNHLSQEALAEKLGISRQAVSKWERAEASPDTDNLILLSKLYHVSLDELLKTEEDIEADENWNFETLISEEKSSPKDEAAEGMTGGRLENEMPKEDREESRKKETSEKDRDQKEDKEYVNIGLGGVHVKDRDGSEVHIGWDGIHVDDKKKEENVHIDKGGVYVNGKKYEGWRWAWLRGLPFSTLICIFYMLIGIMFGAWHPGWLLFLLIPIWYSLASAVKKGNATVFAYPVLVTLVFLCAGFFFGLWHPAWVLYLTIPVYYSLASRLGGSED